MTDNWDSESGKTNFLDENGNLVGDISSWDDRQKLEYITDNLLRWSARLDLDFYDINKELKRCEKLGNTRGMGYEEGRRRENIGMQESIRYLLAVCGITTIKQEK